MKADPIQNVGEGWLCRGIAKFFCGEPFKHNKLNASQDVYFFNYSANI